MCERFYAPDMLDERSVTLSPEESHHLAKVLRCRVGEIVTLFDGRGCEAQGVVATVNRREAVVEVVGGPQHEQPSTRTVTLASAVPKGTRARWLVEKATELGVDAWVPLHTARSVVEPRATKLETLRQNVITACKQCGRNRLMTIAEPRELDEFCRSHQHAAVIVADRTGVPWLECNLPHEGRVIALVGPEGGFDNRELAAFDAIGAVRVRLADHILRIETACVAMAAMLGIWRGEGGDECVGLSG